MNVYEMISKNPDRGRNWPESIFLIKNTEGSVFPVCLASFQFMVKEGRVYFGNLFEYLGLEVVQEHISQSEWDSIVAKRPQMPRTDQR